MVKKGKEDKDFQIIQDLLDGKKPFIAGSKDEILEWWRGNWKRYEEEKKKRAEEARKKEEERIRQLYEGKPLREQITTFKKEMIKEGWGEKRILPFFLIEEELEEQKLSDLKEELKARQQVKGTKESEVAEVQAEVNRVVFQDFEIDVEESLLTEEERAWLENLEKKRSSYRKRDKIAFSYFLSAFLIFTGTVTVYGLLGLIYGGSVNSVNSLFNLFITLFPIIFYLIIHGLFLKYNLRKEYPILEQYLYWNSYNYYKKFNAIVIIGVYFTFLWSVLGILGFEFWGLGFDELTIILNFCVLFLKGCSLIIVYMIYQCINEYTKKKKLKQRKQVVKIVKNSLIVLVLSLLVFIEFHVLMQGFVEIIFFVFNYVQGTFHSCIELSKDFLVTIFKILWRS